MTHGHHGGRGGGGGFRGPRFFGGGGAYFAPPSVYSYPIYDEPEYVPVFIVEDEADRKAKESAKKAASGLGIFSARGPAPARPMRRVRRPGMRGLGDIVFGSKTADDTVLAAQQFLNPLLKARGYLPIDEDGKLGKATCGAVAWLMQGGASDYDNNVYFDLNTAPQAIFAVWNVCASNSQTPPTPVTAAAKSSSYQQAVNQIAATTVSPDQVRDVQNSLNVALKAAGMCAIGVDGKVGAETCGAQTWLIANAGGDGLTQAQRDVISNKCSVATKTAPSACPPQVSAPIVVAPAPTPPSAPIVAAPKPRMSKATMVMGLGIGAAVLGGLYYVYKHKTTG